MDPVLALLVGFLFALSIFCFLRRSLVQLVVGILLLSQAANLAVFSAGGTLVGSPAFVGGDEPIADPLPQALVLTAIVIGFGLVVFALALVERTHARTGSDDMNELTNTDKLS